MSKSILSTGACLFMLGSCAVHPLPEDYAKLDTNHIVFYIRCQASDAINQSAGIYLQSQSDPYTQEQGRLLVERKLSMADLDRKKLNENARYEINKYTGAAIAYDFTFDMTEGNDVGASVNLVNQFTNGTFGVGFNAAQSRQRQTVRNFRITDTFGELTKPNNCAGDPRAKNYGYPITGNIGLEEVVRTFVNLNEFQNLSGKDDKDRAPVLADTLTFQTAISSSVAPKVTISPVTNRFQLGDAGIVGSASRKDIHKVIIALSLPPENDVSGKNAVAPSILGLQSDTSRDFGKTPAEKNALSELSNQIGREIITTLGDRSAR